MCAQRRLRWAWTESSQSAWRKLESRRMPRLIWVFAGRTSHFVSFDMGRLKFLIFLINECSSVLYCFLFLFFLFLFLFCFYLIWALSRENLSWGFAIRVDSNWPAQLQKLGRGLKFRIETRGIILSRQRTTKAPVRLLGCAGWSAPLLFAYGISNFSHDVAHLRVFNGAALIELSKKPFILLKAQIDFATDRSKAMVPMLFSFV